MTTGETFTTRGVPQIDGATFAASDLDVYSQDLAAYLDDNMAGLISGTYATINALANAAHNRYFAWSTDALALYRCDGSAWFPVGGIFSMTTTQRDALVSGGLWDGRVIWNNTAGRLETYTSGGGWVATTPTTVKFYTVHTWTLPGSIAAASGDTNYINPMFVGKHSTETVVIEKVKYQINSGTSVTFKLQVNGADATGFTGISMTTTAAVTDPANVTLADGDKLVPVVNAATGSPVNGSITAWLLHTVTLS